MKIDSKSIYHIDIVLFIEFFFKRVLLRNTLCKSVWRKKYWGRRKRWQATL